MECSFKWNKTPNQIINGVGINAGLNKFAANVFSRHMTKYVPMRKGSLSQNFVISSDSNYGYVTYTQPYARRMYYGTHYKFSTEQHELATAYWDKACWNAEKSPITAEINAYRMLRSWL